MLYVKYTAQPLAWENVVVISAQIPRVLFEVCACRVLLSKCKFLATVLTGSATPRDNVLSGMLLPFSLQYRHSLNVQKHYVSQSS